jgi:hypothetical protein
MKKQCHLRAMTKEFINLAGNSEYGKNSISRTRNKSWRQGREP